jgi:hypothetical protein
MWIPLEEFHSAGNLGIVEAARDYTRGVAVPFHVYLVRCLSHTMSRVVRAEWSGWVEYERSAETFRGADGRHRHKERRRLYHAPAIDPLPLPEIDDASTDHPRMTPRPLQTTVPYEDRIYIQEGLQWLQTHINGKRLDYVQRYCDDEMIEIARQDGVARQTVQKTITRVQTHVQQWATEVSYAAAD